MRRIAIAVCLWACISGACAQEYGWRVIARPNMQGLTTVAFVDSVHGFIGGSSAPVYWYTNDGGNSWLAGSGGLQFIPQAISMVNQQSGWAAGYSGSFAGIVRTTTAGTSWVDQRLVLGHRYNGTAALTTQQDITVGEKASGLDTSLIIQTTNGGTSWTEQRLSPNTRLRKVLFLDSLHGWVLKDSNSFGFILRTTDGGQNWVQHATPYLFTVLSFIDTMHGWAVGAGTFYETRDGGTSWHFLYTIPGLPMNDDDFFAFALSFTDSLYGWAFGTGVYQGRITEDIYRTTNGGNYWFQESIGLTPDLNDILDAVMLDRRHGWAVCGGGWVLGYRPTMDVVERLPEIPLACHLRPNYPNPFNPSTIIEYELPVRSTVVLKVFDALGREVRTLVDGTGERGVYRVVFDATGLASGTYFYTLQANQYTETRQMILVK